VFAGVGKTEAEIEAALEYGIYSFNVATLIRKRETLEDLVRGEE